MRAAVPWDGQVVLPFSGGVGDEREVHASCQRDGGEEKSRLKESEGNNIGVRKHTVVVSGRAAAAGKA